MQDDSDVLACAVDPLTGSIAVVDAYNVPDVDNDVRDTVQVRKGIFKTLMCNCMTLLRYY